jgi:hypothetical protein
MPCTRAAVRALVSVFTRALRNGLQSCAATPASLATNFGYDRAVVVACNALMMLV